MHAGTRVVSIQEKPPSRSVLHCLMRVRTVVPARTEGHAEKYWFLAKKPSIDCYCPKGLCIWSPDSQGCE